MSLPRSHIGSCSGHSARRRASSFRVALSHLKEETSCLAEGIQKLMNVWRSPIPEACLVICFLWPSMDVWKALQLSSNCFTKTMITQTSMLPRDRFHGSLSATMSTNDNESLLEVTQRPESALFSLRSFPARYVAGFGLTSEPLER